jgi:broad specificity phosphatase PhoE
MGNIYLVRHGQASWDRDDYDQLSDLGAQQAAKLGDYWRTFEEPCAAVSGTMLRHQQTADGFFSGLQQRVPIRFNAGFNEFNHEQVLYRYKPEWRDLSVMRQYIAQQDEPDRVFMTHFTNALARWISGQYDDYDESFVRFRSRCYRALTQMIEETRLISNTEEQPKSTVVFTSGGVIAMICGELMGLSHENSLKLNRRIVNSSVTKIVYSAGASHPTQITLDSFNNYSHLDLLGPSWVTRK